MPEDHRPDPDATREILDLARDRSLGRMGMAGHPGVPVSERVIGWSRCLSAIVAISYSVLLGAPPFRLLAFLVLPMSIAWFPNQVASATGSLGVLQRVTRPSPPLPLLILAWVLLLFPLWITPVAALARHLSA